MIRTGAWWVAAGAVIVVGAWSTPAWAADSAADAFAVTADLATGAVDELGDNVAPVSGAQTALRVLVMMTLLSLLPAILLTMTAFARIMIVLTFLRQALGVQGMPPTQVLTGMALFLTCFIMAPVTTSIYDEAIVPLQNDEITTTQALERGQAPLAKFMLSQCQDEDLRLFYDISERPRPASRRDVHFVVLVPAFVLSELRTAFQMGFLIMVPFLVIDVVVSSILMAMGMVMLPPALVALPVKLMVFVLVDGWALVVGSLARSFG